MVDWQAIEAAYREGTRSTRAIARDGGVTEGAIRKRIRAKGWPARGTGVGIERVLAGLHPATQLATSLGCAPTSAAGAALEHPAVKVAHILRV